LTGLPTVSEGSVRSVPSNGAFSSRVSTLDLRYSVSFSVDWISFPSMTSSRATFAASSFAFSKRSTPITEFS